MKKFFILLAIIVTDQLLKYFSVQKLLPSLGGVFHSTCNPAFSWGISLKGVWFWILWLIAFGGLIFLIKKHNYNILLIIAFSGAITNLIDRVFRGCVVDFISISIFPIFNFADICITLGISLFVLNFIKPSPFLKKKD